MSDGDEWDVTDAAEESSDEEGEEHDVADVGAADLLALGMAVVPSFDEVTRRHWNARLFAAMDDFPEYARKGRGTQRVLGGFGALGNPSSFHHPEVRVFRRMRKKLVFRPLLAAYASLAFRDEAEVRRALRLESLFDRLCVRCEDFKRPGEEVWHRDIYGAKQYNLRPLPHSLPNGAQDLLFGGWTNLDHRAQHFMGLLGTHAEADTSGKAGFAEFSKAEVEHFGFVERLQRQAGRAYGHTVRTDARGYVVVPPGHTLIFQQQVIHSVVSGPQPETPALRVFHGIRLTGETAPLFADVTTAMENGAVPRKRPRRPTRERLVR